VSIAYLLNFPMNSGVILRSWLNYLARANTAGTDTEVLCLPIYYHFDLLQIRQPPSFGMIICMTYVAASAWTLSTYITYF